MPVLSRRVQEFTDSVIRRMTRISNEYGAINLSQGFPDFDPPQEIMDALAKAAHEGPHQYSITFGAENFREALARKQSKAIGREINPDTEIVVTCGGTEAMMATMMTICNPGDKVMVFSPFYENYGADAILSGAEPIYIPLVPPNYDFDINLIEDGFKQGAKAIIICNPSNPCGKVFTEEELLAIGKLALQYDAFCAGVSIGLTYGKDMPGAIEIGSTLAASVITSSENVCPRFMPEELGLKKEYICHLEGHHE